MGGGAGRRCPGRLSRCSRRLPAGDSACGADWSGHSQLTVKPTGRHTVFSTDVISWVVAGCQAMLTKKYLSDMRRQQPLSIFKAKKSVATPVR